MLLVLFLKTCELLGYHGDGMGVSTWIDTDLLHVWNNVNGPGQCASGKDSCLSSFPSAFCY